MSDERAKSTSVGEEANALIEALRDDAAALRKEVDALKKDAVRLGRRATKRASDRLEDGLDDASDGASELYDDAKSEAESVADDLRGQIGDRPLIAIGAAVGVGLLLGRTLARR